MPNLKRIPLPLLRDAAAALAARFNRGPAPATRGDCQDGPRPCPFASCRYHLSPPRTRSRAARAYSGESCALDLADAGPQTLEEIGHALGITRERVRQLEHQALRRLGKRAALIRAYQP